MMNGGFTLALLGLLALALVWIAVVDIRTYTISDRLNLGIALLAPVYWWAASVPLWILSGGPEDDDHLYLLAVAASMSRSAWTS